MNKKECTEFIKERKAILLDCNSKIREAERQLRELYPGLRFSSVTIENIECYHHPDREQENYIQEIPELRAFALPHGVFRHEPDAGKPRLYIFTK